MQVRIYVTPKGVQRVFLVSPKKKSSIESLAFYAQIEPAIEHFKSDVRKSLSAYRANIPNLEDKKEK